MTDNMNSEIRLAQKGETDRQKEIWKVCFGDSDQYIDFFYTNRYKADETALLLEDGRILAMLTMIPIKLVTPDQQSYDSAMLYAIATHPSAQNRGLATKLMDFSHQYLKSQERLFSVLVPANKQLFDFYRKKGYQDGFYLRETQFTREGIERLPIAETIQCKISDITAEEYNLRRNDQLSGRLYISYADAEIAYQKKLSKLSGADIYGVNIGEEQGCVVIERLQADKVFIKELLVSDDSLHVALQHIAQLIPAQEYILRTPTFLGEHLEGSICRPFGVIRINGEVNLKITQNWGYLGLAFD